MINKNHQNWAKTEKGKVSIKKSSLKYCQSAYGKKKREQHNIKYRSTIHGHMQKLWAQTKLRAQKKNVSFDLTVNFLKELWLSQKGRCAITGREMVYGVGVGRRRNGISLDRIESELGYKKTNVRFICDVVNMMRNNMPDEELRDWCRDIIASDSTGKLIPNFNTFADVVDRLAVTTHKLAFYENLKREESLKETPNEKMIVHWDRLSRNECEYRNLLKREMDRILENIVKNKKYETLPDYRTFKEPPKKVSEIIAEVEPADWKEQLVEALEREL